jgi:hypothetical protein
MTGLSRISRSLQVVLTATALAATLLGAAGCAGKPTPVATGAAASLKQRAPASA